MSNKNISNQDDSFSDFYYGGKRFDLLRSKLVCAKYLSSKNYFVVFFYIEEIKRFAMMKFKEELVLFESVKEGRGSRGGDYLEYKKINLRKKDFYADNAICFLGYIQSLSHFKFDCTKSLVKYPFLLISEYEEILNNHCHGVYVLKRNLYKNICYYCSYEELYEFYNDSDKEFYLPTENVTS